MEGHWWVRGTWALVGEGDMGIGALVGKGDMGIGG